MILRLTLGLALLISTQFIAVVAMSSESKWLVVVHHESAVSSLTHKQVMSLFLGRAKFLPSGERARALDFPIGSDIRAGFYQSLTGKNIADIDAYWARLQYSGKASPPVPVSGSDQIMELVGKESSAIAYLPSHFQSQIAEHGLKVVFTIDSQQ